MNKIYLWKWQKWTMKKLLGSLRVWYEKWKNPTSFYYNLGYALNSKYYLTFSPDFNLSVFPFSSSSIFITVHCGVCSDHSLLIKDWVLFTHTPTTVLLFLSPLLFSCPFFQFCHFSGKWWVSSWDITTINYKYIH